MDDFAGAEMDVLGEGQDTGGDKIIEGKALDEFASDRKFTEVQV